MTYAIGYGDAISNCCVISKYQKEETEKKRVNMSGTRSEKREGVFLLLFEAEFHSKEGAEHFLNRTEEEEPSEPDPYVVQTFSGVLQEKDTLDQKINQYSTKWKASRLSKVALCALRLAIYEILHGQDVGTAVAINEAVELVKKYDSEESAKYINGVLGGFVKNEELQ